MPYHRAHHRQVYHKVRALPRMVSLGFFQVLCAQNSRVVAMCSHCWDSCLFRLPEYIELGSGKLVQHVAANCGTSQE